MKKLILIILMLVSIFTQAQSNRYDGFISIHVGDDYNFEVPIFFYTVYASTPMEADSIVYKFADLIETEIGEEEALKQVNRSLFKNGKGLFTELVDVVYSEYMYERKMSEDEYKRYTDALKRIFLINKNGQNITNKRVGICDM